MSKQRLSNLADNYSHLNHITWQWGRFFHNIKQFRSTADCTSQKVQLQADARLSLFIWRHIQYVNRVKNWFVIQNKCFPLLGTRGTTELQSVLTGQVPQGPTVAWVLETPRSWGLQLITPHLQPPTHVYLCNPFPFQGAMDTVPRRLSDRPDGVQGLLMLCGCVWMRPTRKGHA